jgi:hypothetical protein
LLVQMVTDLVKIVGGPSVHASCATFRFPMA